MIATIGVLFSLCHPRSWTITCDDPGAEPKVTPNRSLWDTLAEAVGADAVTVLATDEDIRAAEGNSGTTGTTTWPSPPA